MDGGLYKLSKLINRYFVLVRRIIRVNQVYAAYEARIALVVIMILTEYWGVPTLVLKRHCCWGWN